MPAQRIPGKQLAKQIIADLQATVSAMNTTPGMAAVLIGNDPASELYIKLKERTCTTIGVSFTKIQLPQTVSQSEVCAVIDELNQRNDIHGILVQLPLPKSLDTDVVIAQLDPKKDVDGFHPENIERYMADNPPYIRPVLIKSILRLIEHTQEFLRDKRAVILGNSDVFMRPLGSALLRKDMQVVWQTLDDDWEAAVASADVLITAIGKPHHITAQHVKPGAIIVDVGISDDGDAVKGDVAPNAAEIAQWITPVPGGVGPMTVAMLTENVVELAQRYGN